MHHAAEMELKRMSKEQRATVEREFGRRIDVANRMLAVIETEAKQLSTAAEKEVRAAVLNLEPISRAVLNVETLREQEAVNESFRSSFCSIGAAKRVAKNWKARAPGRREGQWPDEEEGGDGRGAAVYRGADGGVVGA